MIYLDTSALAKKYIREAGSDMLNELISSAPAVSFATSRITFPEMLSAFYRRKRAGDLSSAKLTALTNKFENDWDYLYVIDFHDELLPIIKKTIKKHFLKAADAIHLSSALWLKKAIKEDVIFVASDKTLINAAEAETLIVLDPLSR